MNAQELNNFTPKKRLEYFQGVHRDNNEPFVGLDKEDFFRLLGTPNELIIEEINEVPFEKRLKRANEIGLTSMIKGVSWSYINDRPVIFTKVGGENIPFYRSSVGTGGNKIAGVWYPFFGVGAEGWIIKGGGDNFETCYNNPILKKIQDILNNTFNWNHELDFEESNDFKNHPLSRGENNIKTFCPPMMLDTVLYGKNNMNEYSPEIKGGRSFEWIKELVTKMYERYPIDHIKKIVDFNTENLIKLGYEIKNINENLKDRV